MGDFADMALDDLMSIDYHQGNGTFDGDDDPYWSPFSAGWFGFTPRPKTCKRCGAKGLYWAQKPNGRWYLEDYDGDLDDFVPHQCSFNFKGFIGK